eukprot:8089-Heterococcus_DN1.PRE.2
MSCGLRAIRRVTSVSAANWSSALQASSLKRSTACNKEQQQQYKHGISRSAAVSSGVYSGEQKQYNF